MNRLARPRLLISARDLGAAAGIAEVLAELERDGRMEVLLVAMEPAFSYLRRRGHASRACDAAPVVKGDGPDAMALVGDARTVIADAQPAAILVGLSGVGAGIDEALLAAADRIPTFALQDFCGDVNLTLGVAAGTYLVADDEAAALTRSIAAAATVVVGAPKYAAFGQSRPIELRHSTRERLGVATGQAIFGFFGQPLGELADYPALPAALAAAVAALDDGSVLLYRPHPKEPEALRAAVRTGLDASGLEWHEDVSPDASSAIAACDVVSSAFSTCGVDYLYLNRESPMPLGNVVYLFPASVADVYRAHTRIDFLPAERQGLATAVRSMDALPSAVARSRNPAAAQSTWERCREVLPSPELAARRCVEVLAAAVL